MSLTVSMSEKEAGIVTISPVGVIDASTYPVLETQVDSVLRMPPRALIFDMAGVTYISSAGVRVILKAKKYLARDKGKVMMVNLQPSVKRVFDIINALPPQQLFASVEELDAYLDKMQKGI